MTTELNDSRQEQLDRYRLSQTIDRSTALPDNTIYSATEQMGSSASQGFDDSLVFGQLPEVIKKVSAGYFDKNNNLEPLTDEQFEQKGYSIFGEDFKREPAETPTQTKYRFERYVQTRVNQQNVGGGGKLQTAANFAAGFAGGFAGDLPIAFVPYAAVASRVSQATNAVTKGAAIARAAQVKSLATKASQLESAMASGSKLKVSGLVLKDYAKEAVIATNVETALWGASSTYLGDEVTGKDLLINGAFSLGASAAFSPIALRSAFKKQKEVVDFNNNLETVSTFFEEGNTSAAAIKLVDFYEPAKQLARQNEEFAFLLNDKLEVTDLTPEQVDLADKFASEISLNETKQALAQHLLNNVFSEATEGGPSQEDLARDIKSQTERIYKAMDDNSVHTLEERDWEALVLSGWQPSEQMQIIRNKYLEYTATPEYAEMSSYPALNAENKQTAKRILREYDGPAFEVVEDFDMDTLASVNPDTGRIRLNPTRIKEDWDAGLPHLTGESDSASSPQKKIVFAKIDIEKFKEAVGSWEGYQKFILAHEQGHLALKHTRGKRADWLKEEAINKELAANEYAAELLGIDWLSLAKGTDVPIAPFDPDSQGLPSKVTPEENFKQSREKIIETFADDTIDPKPEPKQADIITEPVTRLERDQADYSLLTNDRKGFFVDQTNQVFGNEKVLGIIQSTPEGYNPVKDKGNLARKKHVRTVLEENGLEQYSDVAESIVDTLGSYDFYLKSVNDFFEQYNPKNKGTHAFDTKGIPDDIKRSAYILLGENDGDPLKAQAAIIESLEESKSALILRTVRDAKIENQLVDGANQYSTPKQRIEWLQTQLDGQQRAGIDSRSSFNTKSKAQVVIDAKPINDVLDKHGLWDLFIGAGSGPYMDVLRRETGGNTDAIKIYGKDLRNHINDFAGDIMVAIRTGDTPTKWKGVEAFEELVEAINGVRQSQLTQLNRNGSNVRVRSDFSGWSQRWSNDTVKKIGFDRWRTDMINGVDWDATAKAHGGRLIRTDGKEVPFDKELYLKEWYYKITELREQTDGSDVAKSFEQSRMVVIKPAAEAKILAKYSGEQNLGKLLMDQIRYRSEMIASIETLGGNPLQTIQNTLDKSQLVRGDNVGKFKYDTVIGTTRLLTNDLDNPVDASFASIFKSVRKVGNLAFLPLSGFSALMDIPLSISTLKYTGAEITMSEYMPQFLEAMSRQFRGDKTGMSAYFRDVGAAYDVVNNASLRQITGDVSGEKGFLDLAMSFMFEANGMLRTTAAGQEAFADWTSRSLGREAAAGKFSDLRIESLKNFGFTDADIDVLLKSVNKDAPDGINRVMPQTVEDGNVSTKLREYYLHYMKQAVLEPDAGAQAITRGNFKAGTVGGESMRTGFQYTSFILGLSRTLYGRFAHGYTGSQLNHIRAMSHLVAFVGTSLAAAWVVTVMKDLVRGKAPINPLNMGNFDMQRILSQSGLVGIGELPFELLGGGLPISPIAKAPLKVATGVVTADREKVAKAVSPFVGGNLPVIGGPIKSMLGMAFLEAGQEFLKNEIDQINRL